MYIGSHLISEGLIDMTKRTQVITTLTASPKAWKKRTEG